MKSYTALNRKLQKIETAETEECLQLELNLQITATARCMPLLLRLLLI